MTPLLSHYTTFRPPPPALKLTLSRCPTPAHGICTLSPLHAALTMRFAQNTQHDTSQVLHLPRKMTMEVSKVPRLPRKMQLMKLKYCACHTKRLLTRLQTHENVTRCHACRATRHYNQLCYPQKGQVLQLPHRHGDAERKPKNRDETCGSPDNAIRKKQATRRV